MSKLRLAGAVIGLTGIALVGFFSSWLAALGMFLALTGNNFERSGRQP